MDTEPSFVHEQGERNASIIQINYGKHLAAIVVCAVVCGMSVVFAWRASHIADDAATEYRVLLNHTMELEAKQKVLIDEVQELKHERR